MRPTGCQNCHKRVWRRPGRVRSLKGMGTGGIAASLAWEVGSPVSQVMNRHRAMNLRPRDNVGARYAVTCTYLDHAHARLSVFFRGEKSPEGACHMLAGAQFEPGGDVEQE